MKKLQERILKDGKALSETVLKVDSFLNHNVAPQLMYDIGIVIEKSFQPGRILLDKKGYDVYSLARIAKLDKGIIEFLL